MRLYSGLWTVYTNNSTHFSILVPDGRLPLLLEHGHLLDLVLHTMNSYSQDGRLQHYSVSFLALLVSVGEASSTREGGREGASSNCNYCRIIHLWIFFMVMIVLFHVYLVATQIEIGVMQVIVERVAVTMEAMSHDYHVTYWGCKVFAHAASNGEKMTLCRDCYVALCTCIYMCIYVHSSPVLINFCSKTFPLYTATIM